MYAMGYRYRYIGIGIGIYWYRLKVSVYHESSDTSPTSSSSGWTMAQSTSWGWTGAHSTWAVEAISSNFSIFSVSQDPALSNSSNWEDLRGNQLGVLAQQHKNSHSRSWLIDWSKNMIKIYHRNEIGQCEENEIVRWRFKKGWKLY